MTADKDETRHRCNQCKKMAWPFDLLRGTCIDCRCDIAAKRLEQRVFQWG